MLPVSTLMLQQFFHLLLSEILGITLDPALTLDAYISKLSKAAVLHLRRLAQLRSYVSPKDAESLVQAYCVFFVAFSILCLLLIDIILYFILLLILCLYIYFLYIFVP